MAVVTCPRASCSGAAYSGVSGAPASRVSALVSTGREPPHGASPSSSLAIAEVEQLDVAVAADEHVGRLEVAVHDQVGVRVGDGLQDIEEQAQPGLDAERVLGAVAVDALTVDVLDDEIRLARLRHPGIDEVGDVGMGQPGQEVAFAPEALLAGRSHQRQVQQLDRRAPFEAAVAAFGQPDAAHPALADERNQPVGPEGLPGQ